MSEYSEECSDNKETLHGTRAYFEQTVIENSKMCHYKNYDTGKSAGYSILLNKFACVCVFCILRKIADIL